MRAAFDIAGIHSRTRRCRYPRGPTSVYEINTIRTSPRHRPTLLTITPNRGGYGGRVWRDASRGRHARSRQASPRSDRQARSDVEGTDETRSILPSCGAHRTLEQDNKMLAARFSCPERQSMPPGRSGDRHRFTSRRRPATLSTSAETPRSLRGVSLRGNLPLTKTFICRNLQAADQADHRVAVADLRRNFSQPGV